MDLIFYSYKDKFHSSLSSVELNTLSYHEFEISSNTTIILNNKKKWVKITNEKGKENT